MPSPSSPASSPAPVDPEQLKRWRLILGAHAQDSLARMGPGCELSAEQRGMDDALAAIYDETETEEKRKQRSAGLACECIVAMSSTPQPLASASRPRPYARSSKASSGCSRYSLNMPR